MSAKNKAGKLSANFEQNQHMAMKHLFEELIDDLIESNNGLDLDAEWAGKRLGELLEARDKPVEYLTRPRFGQL